MITEEKYDDFEELLSADIIKSQEDVITFIVSDGISQFNFNNTIHQPEIQENNL